MSNDFDTLPDLLRPDLKLVSIGLNPSLPSVAAGFYFANPRNRFWKALNGAELIDHALTPGIEAQQSLFDDYRIGFTDVVKRPSANGSQLRAADYRQWAPVLKEKLLEYRPQAAWFHGRQAWQYYLKHAEGLRDDEPAWGEQAYRIDGIPVYVSPNPSPANAAFSLETLITYYRGLKGYISGS